MNLLAQALACEVGDHLVDVHVGARPRAGLEDAERELVRVPAFGNLERSGGDRGRNRLRQLAEFAIRLRGRPLDEADGADQLLRHAGAPDAEVVRGALRLGAPQHVGGDAYFAEAVLFDAVFGAHG